MPAAATQSIFFVFLPCPLSALGWPHHSCQSTPSSSASAFRISAVASPPCCLPPLHIIPTFLWRQGRRVSAAIFRLSLKPRPLQRWDLPSGTRLPWHKAWGRDCCQQSLVKQVVSDLFNCRVCYDCCKCSWDTRGGLGRRNCHGTPRGPWR